MNTSTIQKAVDKHYTDFSNDVKAALKTKLDGHEAMVEYKTQVDKIREFKTTFAGMNGTNEPSEPAAPAGDEGGSEE